MVIFLAGAFLITRLAGLFLMIFSFLDFFDAVRVYSLGASILISSFMIFFSFFSCVSVFTFLEAFTAYSLTYFTFFFSFSSDKFLSSFFSFFSTIISFFSSITAPSMRYKSTFELASSSSIVCSSSFIRSSVFLDPFEIFWNILTTPSSTSFDYPKFSLFCAASAFIANSP